MPLTAAEKIKIILGRRKMTIAQLAENLGQSRQNLTNKMTRDNFSEKELIAIAKVLECDFNTSFIMRDSGESI